MSWIIDLISWALSLWMYWLPLLTFMIGLGWGAQGAKERQDNQFRRLTRRIEVPKTWRSGEIKVPLDGRPLTRPEMAVAALVVRVDAGHGSGVCVSSHGLVLTNAHVVGNATVVEVEDEKTSHLGVVVKVRESRDVAAIYVETSLTAAAIHEDEPGVGDDIYVAGTPMHTDNKHLLTRGVISKIGLFDRKKFIHMDAGIAPGNSGGPAFDGEGRLVGLTVAIQTDNGERTHIGLAIPIAEALAALKIEGEPLAAAT